MFDDVTVESSDAVDWDADTEVAVGAALESEAPLWPQALSAAAALITTAAAAALAGSLHTLSLRCRQASKQEPVNGSDSPAACGPS